MKNLNECSLSELLQQLKSNINQRMSEINERKAKLESAFSESCKSYYDDISIKKKRIETKANDINSKINEISQKLNDLNQKFSNSIAEGNETDSIEIEIDSLTSLITSEKSKLAAIKQTRVVGDVILYKDCIDTCETLKREMLTLNNQVTELRQTLGDIIKELTSFNDDITRSNVYGNGMNLELDKLVKIYENQNGPIETDINGAGSLEEAKRRYVSNNLLF